MPLYENVFITRQDASTAQVEALGETFAGIIQANGGQVPKKEYWGLRNLSFRMKKNRKGHYMLLNIDAPAPAVIEMERNMRINEDVLRYLTVRVEALEEGPSAILQNRGREGRDGDRDRGDRRGGRFFRDRGDRDRDRDRGDRDRDRDRDRERERAPTPAPEAAPEGEPA
jgi:small subunit ribosomal protein S6